MTNDTEDQDQRVGQDQGVGRAVPALALLVGVLLAGLALAPGARAIYVFQSQWGSYGSGDGQFEYPSGIAVDSGGNVYVADSGNDRIQKFSPGGAYDLKWGVYGSDGGELDSPIGVAYDGFVYVADTGNDRIKKFSTIGGYYSQVGGRGSEPGQLESPYGLAAHEGRLYVADTYNNRLQVFTNSGFLYGWGSPGSGNGEFSFPQGVAIASGVVYVADDYNRRVQRFTLGGSYLGQWGGEGSGDGQFRSTYGIAVADSGDVLVSDYELDRVSRFTSTGVFLESFGGNGSGNGQFRGPWGVAAYGPYLYVVDRNYPRIERFVDVTLDTSINQAPPGLGNDSTPTFGFSANVSGSSFECRLDGGGWFGCTSPYTSGGLGDGGHVFEVRAVHGPWTDTSPASSSFTIDTAPPPAPTIVGSDPPTPSPDPFPRVRGTANGATTVKIYRDSCGGTLLESGSAEEFSSIGIQVVLPLDQTVKLRAGSTDAAGNVSGCSNTFAYTNDTLEPETTIDSGPAGPVNLVDAGFAFSSEPGARFECRLDGGGWSSCDSPREYTGLGDGPHSFEARATDSAGNVDSTPARREFTVDTVPPETKLWSGPSGPIRQPAARFEFESADPSAGFQCRLDSGGFAPCTSPHEYTGLDDGAHGFEVRAVDEAGNADPTPVRREFTVDTVAPTTTVESGPSGPTADNDPSFVLSANEPVTTFRCLLNLEGTTSDCGSPQTYADLPDGDYTLIVWAIDPAGNSGPGVWRRFSVDTVPPPTPGVTDTDPSSPANDNQPRVRGSAGGDRDPDLAVASDSVLTLLGAPGAGFSGPISISYSISAYGLAAGDLNGDSDPDLVAIRPERGVRVELGTPGQGFAEAGDFPAHEGPRSGAVADFDGDGDADLAVANTDSHDVSILLGNGNGGFGAPTQLAAGSLPSAVTVADFNGDGDPDLAVPSGDDRISVLLGGVGASFSGAVPYRTGTWPGAVSVADFNGDGDLDLATPDTGSSTVSVLLGGPGGTFGAAVNYAAGSYPKQIAVADFDGDGDPDLAVADEGSGGISVLLGGPGGSFSSAASYPAGDGPSSIVGADFDGDGNTDLAVANRYSGDLSVLVGDGEGGFTPAGTLPAGSYPVSLLSAEFGVDASRVRLYADDEACGAAAAEGTRTAFEGAGIPLGVADDHTTQIRARSVDAAGNVSGCSEPFPYREDSSPPETTIDSGPGGLINVSNASFSFNSESGASFECRLDGGEWQACASPKPYSGLNDGSYTFEVRALDTAGNPDPTPASRSFSVDTNPPETTIDSGPGGLINVSNASFSFSSEPGAGFECRLDGGEWQGCESPREYTGLTDGSHTFAVRATDPAGNTGEAASRSFSVDTSPPTTTIDSGPSGTISVDHASFSFSSEPGASFECRLDGGEWQGCESPREYTGLTDGSHTFAVRATDPVGNTGEAASRSFSVDTSPPTTTIDSGPSGLINVPNASFSFNSESGASFECRLDGGEWQACASPKPYSGLGDGAHSFAVRATDPAGNTGEAATRSFSVDTNPPETTIDSGPGGLINVSNASFSFSSESGASFECRLDGGEWQTCESPKSYGGLTDGSHTFAVRATDPAGNTGEAATRSFSVDTNLPETTMDSGPGGLINVSNASFSFSSESGASFECRLDGGEWQACESPEAYSGLGEGPHTFSVRALDAAGNPDPSPASRSFSVDTNPPETTIDSGPSGTIGSRSFVFEFSSSEPDSTFQCRGGGSWTACASPTTFHTSADGTFTIEIRAIDRAGNADPYPAERTITVDTQAPQTTILYGPNGPTPNRHVSFGFSTSEPGAGFECRLVGGGWTECASPREYDLPGDGPYTFEVRAVDAAGNVDSSPASRSFTIDTIAPQTTIDSGPPAVTNDPNPSFGLSSDEPGAGFQCRLYFGSWTACASPQRYTGLADGTHTFEARAVDAAGNVDASPAVRGFIVDTAAPQTTIGSGPEWLTRDPSPSFSFSASESGAAFECRLDGGGWAACSSPRAYASLADGAHSFEVRATDVAGNADPSPAMRSFTIDTVPPETTIASGPANPTNDTFPEFSFSSESGSGFECRFDSGGWHLCTSPQIVYAGGEKEHDFWARATDAAGNADPTPAHWAFVVDVSSPETTIESGPSGLTNDASPSFGFSASEEGARFECRLDGGGWDDCDSPHGYGSLGDGSHRFEVRAVDPAGNVDPSSAQREFTLDATAPPPPSLVGTDPSSPANENGPRVRGFGAEAGSTILIYGDGACGGPVLATGSAEELNGGGVRLALGDDRTYRLTATATDAAGNVSGCSASLEYVEDSTAPDTRIVSGPGATVTSASVAFELAASEPGATFRCSLDGAPFGDCASRVTYAGLPDGHHEFAARAEDAAGNADSTPATGQFSVQAQGPRDTTTPLLQATAKPKQELARKKGVILRLVCLDEPCTARVTGTILGSGRKKLSLQATTVPLAQGGERIVRLRASVRVLRKVAAALAAHRRPKAQIGVAATDTAGNQAAARLTVRLVPGQTRRTRAAALESSAVAGLLQLIGAIFG